ncbi:CHAP protein [Bifidobacterium saguini DSM 23967]|uniref:CHAP protein n=2 Tax=Bifidobacterium saguini TaxID=762210 RepID=A0A087DE59_9BIFI|nr:CHAP domain-containing protein [Bifidobacterium saguini]KFI93809.1 CHAP protein [Bifidobacterium saguini DSM 23967]QTB91549.1 CHAP domain-containing protein [Bifidobacterium saguini]
MKHASHKAAKVSSQKFSLAKALFSSGKGTHSIRSVRAVQSAGDDAAVLGLDPAVAAKINEIAPQTRRSIRQAARAAERRSHILASASLAALVGTAAGAIAFASPEEDLTLADNATTTTQIKRVSDVSSASRSEARSDLSSSGTQSTSTDSSSSWGLSNSEGTLDTNLMNRNTARNSVVAALMDQDQGSIPAGFNPNHDAGKNQNTYPWGQCTWYAYQRRTELGLPIGGSFGDARSWANSASSRGYWVDNTARHTGDVVVFAPGQENADSYYGHVGVVEKVNSDGSIEISESNYKGLGVISTRTFTAEQASTFQYIHY